MHVSKERFFRETNWPRDLAGQKILEVGSGAARSTEIAPRTGAQVFSVDVSRFDKVFCFGVCSTHLDVARGFDSIAEFVKLSGELAVDVYNKNY